jgi:hypothetical protein
MGNGFHLLCIRRPDIVMLEFCQFSPLNVGMVSGLDMRHKNVEGQKQRRKVQG